MWSQRVGHDWVIELNWNEGLFVPPPPNSCWKPNPRCDGVFGNKLGLDRVTKLETSWWNYFPYKRHQRVCPVSFHRVRHKEKVGIACKPGRVLTINQKCCHYALILHSLQNCKIDFCPVCPVYDIFSWQPKTISHFTLRPHGLYSPQNYPGQNTGVGSHSLLQGIFPTQGLTQVFHIAGRFFASGATSEVQEYWSA